VPTALRGPDVDVPCDDVDVPDVVDPLPAPDDGLEVGELEAGLSAMVELGV
jgi:hypothetical protein